MKESKYIANNGKKEHRVTVASLLNKITNVNNELVEIKENLFDKVYKFEDISGTVRLLADLDVECELTLQENVKLNKLDSSIKNSLYDLESTEKKSDSHSSLNEMINKANLLLDDISSIQSNFA